MTSRNCFLFLFIIIGSLLFSQTKRIAHKSHSGKAHTFKLGKERGFGLPPERTDSVVKINNDSVVIYKSDRHGFAKSIPQAYKNHYHFNNSSIDKDSLMKLYPGVKLIGFDAVIKKKKKIAPKKGY